jgi:transcriptional regulator with XRE-family HTH domain
MSARPRKEIDLSTYEGRFAARLRELREKAKLSPEQVAEALGVSLAMVYNYEQAIHTPKVSAYPKLAELFKLKTVNSLLPEN